MSIKYITYLVSASFAAAFVSCTKSGGSAADEHIEISPQEITVSSDLCAKTFEVTSNSNWTISLTGTDGSAVSWAEPDKTAGKGNSTVTLKIYANMYKNQRSATLTVTAAGGKAASAAIVQSGNEDSQVDDSKITVRIGTFNLRMSNLDDGDNAWTNRKSRVMQAIQKNDFDFFGVQECSTQTQKDLVSETGSIYECKFFSPYSQTGNGDKAQGLLYKKTEFTLSDWHFFWPSENPDEISQNDTGSAGNYSRGGCCGVLTHNQTGIKIFIMVTHAFLNDEPNNRWAYVYADMEEKYNTAGYPSFFVGDMNAKPSDPPSVEFRKHWSDTYQSLSPGDITGPSGTYNGFNLNVNLNNAARLDYIYYRGAAEPIEYVADDSKYGGFWPSDHLPVYAEFTVNSTY